MIKVEDLDNIARARIEDAKALSAVGQFDGATYLCGYAIEVALKARICRTLNWPEFPATRAEFQAYRSFQTHELDVLLHLSGQEARIKQNQFALWNVVAVWKVELRYNIAGTTQQAHAAAMIQAAGGNSGKSMMVSDLKGRFSELETKIAADKGGFTFFALFMLEDVPDRWDLIVSAPWTGDDKRAAVEYFVNEIKSKLGGSALIGLSRIVVVDPQDPAMQAINRAIQIEHGAVEVRDTYFFGLPIKNAYIITSNRPPAPAIA